MKHLVLIFLSLVLFSACKPQSGATGAGTTGSAQQPSTTTPPAQATTATAPSTEQTVWAKINGESVNDAEVYEQVKSRLKKLESQIFDIKRGGLNDVIEEKLLKSEADKRHVSVDDLLKKEAKVEEPSEQEIQTFYSMFKEKFGDQTLDKVKPQLVAQIKSTRAAAVREQFIDKLKKDAKIEILMQRPRIEVSVDDDPSQGKKDAPITLIEFSEYQCPFCKRTRPTIQKIMDTYKDKVQYVFRDFPLSFHKQAPVAALAANCANEQGKYWEYNKELFEQQPNLSDDNLKEYAKKLGLNTKKFDECLGSGKYQSEIDKDIQDGSNAGVTGTPAYFINGIFISGAQPFENFKEIIDEELMMKK